MNRAALETLLAKAPPSTRKLNRHIFEEQSSRVDDLAAKFDNAIKEVAAPKSEKHLQDQIEGLLRRNGYFPIRQRMDRKSNVALGCPDILFASKRGIAIAWEVKLPGQRPRPEQTKTHQEMRAAGWVVSVVRQYEDALAWVRADLGQEDTNAS